MLRALGNVAPRHLLDRRLTAPAPAPDPGSGLDLQPAEVPGLSFPLQLTAKK
jgi:hypothetical protein